MDPEKTVFRVASISKTITATAIMQLVDERRIDLNDALETNFQTIHLENTFSVPITVRHLLTHTGGFDERTIGTKSPIESEIPPRGDYLAHRMPPVVRPPGDVFCYSNHGYALAGYLVEEVSRVPFSQYVQENILRPLSMSQSGFGPDERLLSEMAAGYKR